MVSPLVRKFENSPIRAIPAKNVWGGGRGGQSIFVWMSCGILGEFICMGGGVVGKYISMGGCPLGK